ncbi:hypothetical protein niasHT_017190 [Heterodera trifolii]|uniref:Splicing factor YJU2 n=2 Tax=Heterodera trifolii TaxID=157864 RepID=A0ABD2LDE5_9BILA
MRSRSWHKCHGDDSHHAMDELGMDELGMDELGMDELGMDELGMDELGLPRAKQVLEIWFFKQNSRLIPLTLNTLQKYYPPDFDPAKIPKAKQPRNRQFIQRVMTPFNMRCNTCNEYIYKGKKFNMRRETAEGENYLGLKIFRFYFRCPNCLAEITFKTDIENVDYQAEHGATRLFDAFKFYQEQERREEVKEEEEKADAMKMLEKRTKMSKIEMEALGHIEELQESNRRYEKIDAIAYINETEQQRAMSFADQIRVQEEEDEREVERLVGRANGGKIERRLNDDEAVEQEKADNWKMVEAAEQSQQQPIRRRAGPKSARRLYVKAVFTGYKRGHRSQHENTALLKLDGVNDKTDASFYLGKRAVYMYKGHKMIARGGGPKTRVRAIWGRITRVHGNSGVVRAKFHHNLPPSAMGKRIRVMLYPSNI